MNRMATALFLICLGAAVSAQSIAAGNGWPKGRELKQMIRNARTPEDYEALAAYFRSRQAEFTEQARDEHREWVRRMQIVAPPVMKYPRPEDSARNRYEYFTYEAKKMGRLAAQYQSLADHPRR